MRNLCILLRNMKSVLVSLLILTGQLSHGQKITDSASSFFALCKERNKGSTADFDAVAALG